MTTTRIPSLATTPVFQLHLASGPAADLARFLHNVTVPHPFPGPGYIDPVNPHFG